MKHDLSFTKVTNDKQYFDDWTQLSFSAIMFFWNFIVVFISVYILSPESSVAVPVLPGTDPNRHVPTE